MSLEERVSKARAAQLRKTQGVGARVISAWLNDSKFRRAWNPEPDLFLDPTQREVALLGAELGDALSSADVVLFELDSRGRIDAAQGVPAVEELLYGSPAVVDPWKLVAELREARSVRQLRSSLAQVSAGIDSGELGFGDAEETISGAMAEARANAGGARMLSERELYQSVHQRLTDTKPRMAFSSGVEELDRATGGLPLGNVWVMAAETNWGKSSYLLMLVRLARLMGLRPGIVTAEDHPELYGRRLLAANGNISAMRLRDRSLTRDEHRAVAHHLDRASTDCMVLDARGMPVERIVAEVASATLADGVNLWLFDYLQAIRATRQSKDRREELGYIARLLTDVTKNHNAAGVMFSQITVEEGKRPTKKSVRENKDIANGAEVVILGYTETERVEGETIHHRRLLLDKNKDGPTPLIFDLDWDDACACFRPDVDMQRLTQGGLDLSGAA